MALRGVLREGAGGSGVAPLSFDSGTVVFVSASIFGSGVTSDGRAIAACNVVPGVAHSPVRDTSAAQLRLATLAADGRTHIQEAGPLGQGIWFEAPGNHRYALGQRDGRYVFVKHWGTPISDAQIADTGGANPALAAAILAGEFCAGIDASGRLVVVGGTVGLSITPAGTVRTLTWTPAGSFKLVPTIRRLVFRKDRMLLTSVTKGGPKVRRPAIYAFREKATSMTADRGWGTGGRWTGPRGFVPADLLAHPNGGFVCVGWTTVAGGVSLTAIRIAEDGASTTPFIQPEPAVPQPYPFHACLDAAGGLLIAFTGPNPVSVFLTNLAEVAWMRRWQPGGMPDPTFGIGNGVSMAQHLGYPVGVRGLSSTAGGFFLACDRTATIESQYADLLPVVFALDHGGRARTGFGETGIVHHDDIPAALQLRAGSGAVGVGVRRVWKTPGPDELELAVTTLSGYGGVIWTYGTTHGMHSGPVVINGQRSSAFWVNAVTQWGGLLAIGGGDANAGGFVTIRDYNGRLLLPGTTSLVQTSAPVESLQPLPSGALEATYRTASGALEKVRLVSSPSLRVDPTFPPTTVPFPPTLGIVQADGSTIRPKVSVSAFFSPNTLTFWLNKELAGGAIDANYGGAAASNPMARFVQESTFAAISQVSFRAFVRLQGGRFFLLALILSSVPPGTLPKPVGVVAIAWNATDGSPAWVNLFVSHDFVVVSQVLDDGDGIVLVGAKDTGQADTARTAMLLRIRTIDGTLDPAFGSSGILSVPLRSDHRAGGGARQTARPILDLGSGTKVVPVIFEGDDQAAPYQNQPKALTLAWLDIT